MPPIVNNNILPDMGRMTARLHSTVRMRYLLATMAVPKTGLASLH
jgi:hypothetical protein